MTRLNELEEQIKILSSENESLVERAEEIELMALISEKLEDVDKIEDVYEIVLERISIVKTIPYCGVFWLDKLQPIKEADYSYLYDDSNIIETFSLTKTLSRKVLAEQHLYIENTMKDFDKIKIKFFDNNLVPNCFLFISFNVLGRNGFLLFADNCNEHNLPSFTNILEQAARLTASKITNITLLNHINMHNENLEQLVEEKSTELYESEAKYRELIEQLPEVVFIHHKGIVEYCNPATVKLLEVESEAELIGKNIMDFVAPEWRDIILQKMKKMIDAGEKARSPLTEFMMITAKGNKVFTEASGSKFNQLGEGRIQVMIRDITERKLHEQRMRESEEKFRLAFETSPNAITITRLDDGAYILINKGFEKISGYANEEIKGVPSLKINIWENPEDRTKLVEGLKKDGFVNNFKANFKLKDGSVVIGSLSAKIINLNGVPHLLSTTRDITEQEKSKEIIETQNKFLNSVINSLSNPFVVVDPKDYSIILANPAASQGRNIIGEKCYNTYHNLLGNCNESENCPLNEIKETKKPCTVIHEHLTADGELHSFEVHGHPVLDENGELIQMIEYSIDVSEKKKNLLALKESEKKFRTLFDKTAVGLVLLEHGGKITSVNEATLSIFGLTRDEMIGRMGMSLFSKEELKRLPPQIDVIFSKGSVEIERVYTTLKGEKKFLEILGSKLSDELIVVSINDLTEIKQAAEKLKSSEKKFKSLIEQSPIGILIMQKGKIIFANKVLAETLGFKTTNKLLGKNILDFVAPDFKKTARAKMDQLMANGKIVDTLEEKFISKNGKTIDVLMLGQAIEFEGQQAVQGYIYDITEDKKLREENRILKAGIECVDETGIIVTDTAGKITYANPGFTNIYGFSENEIIGENVSIIKSFMMRDTFYNNFETKIRECKTYNGELFNKTKYGKIINAEVSLTPIFSSENKFMGYIEIHKDVTERHKAETELWEAKVAAEQADKIKSEFLAQMSHEIRTPINAIVSFSSLLKDELQDIVSDDLKTSFSLIDRAGQRIIRTIDLLLNLSEIHTGTYQCISKNLHLYNDVLAPVIVNYKYVAQSKNIELKIKKDIKNQMVKADSYALEQIFKNLIDNAIKYTLQGKVEVEILNKDEQVQVKIADTGIGISKEYLPNLFEPFSQEESGYTRSFEGNGIGLSLVKEYCRLNNIKISVESEKGKGTTFLLTFSHN